MNRLLVELRLIGAMILDIALNDYLHSLIDAQDFHEALLRRAWLTIAELKKSIGNVNLDLVCGRIELHGIDIDAESVRELFEYAASSQFAGVGCTAKSDWFTLAQDRGNVLTIEGRYFIAQPNGQ